MYGYSIAMTIMDLSPITQRQVSIPSDITFKKLHEIISLIFNLNTKNKYKFLFDELNIEIKDTGRINRDTIDARYEKIDKYFSAYENIIYTNDFWKISLNIHETEYNKKYPQIGTIKGFYNPISSISSVEEFANVLEYKQYNYDEYVELKINLKRINKIKIQKNLLLLFNIPYEIKRGKIKEIKDKNTLDKLL